MILTFLLVDSIDPLVQLDRNVNEFFELQLIHAMKRRSWIFHHSVGGVFSSFGDSSFGHSQEIPPSLNNLRDIGLPPYYCLTNFSFQKFLLKRGL